MLHDLLAHLPTFPQGLRAHVNHPAEAVGLQKISNVRRGKMDRTNEVAQLRAGHTDGSHTWSHRNLARMKPDEAKMEIEKGISAVEYALGKPATAFFRFPVLQHPPALVTYLGERNVSMFSTDLDSFDFKMRRPEQVIASVMKKLEKHGKGIVLMHDFQKVTADALPDLLKKLKVGGYKVVHMTGKTPVKSLPEYDELLKKEIKLPTVSDRPTSSVVRTIE
jgi:peptidoglycan/xylan/chitin deacetylase (PgdA/CDA1 family)